MPLEIAAARDVGGGSGGSAPAAAARQLAAPMGRQLRSLIARRAADLPRCSVAAAIEAHLAAELAAACVTLPSALVVRVVSRKHCCLAAPPSLAECLDEFPEGFP